MTKMIIVAVLVVTAFVLAPRSNVPRGNISAIHTDSAYVNEPEVFKGCPHLMYQTQEPNPTISVESVWTDTMEKINVELSKDTFQRSHGG